MIKLLKYLTKKELLLMIISIILIYVDAHFTLRMPDYMAEITKLVQTEGSKMSDILTNGGYMMMCAGICLICDIIIGYFIAYISCNFSKNVRKKLFLHVESLSNQDIKEISTSSLITRTTNDITQVEMFLTMGSLMLFKAPITAGMAVVKILNKNFTWSMLTAGALLILLITIIIITTIVVPRFKKIQKLTDDLNNATRENLTGVRVVRAFNAEDYQENKFDKVNKDLTSNLLFNQSMFSIMQPTMYLVLNTLTLGIYYFGAKMIYVESISNKLPLFGDMIVFSSYAMQVIMSFLMLAMIFMMMPRASVSAKRINEVLNKKASIKEGNDNKKTKESGTVEFKNVSFKYPDADEYVLKDISFKANKGETVAFIGMTGSGKSTLINLIPRFYDVTEGSVLVNDINVKDYKEETLNNKLGYVSQKPIIFNGTVNFNISFGKKISDKKIKEAARIAKANEFIEKMEDKYSSHIASSGTNISGGQKQRISIARAIAKDPEIYIFDDAFSALDYKTDFELRKGLKKYTKDATVLIVAQRIGTIMNADKIIVLDDGKCVGVGTHKELLKTCKIYKNIALSQLSEEELS